MSTANNESGATPGGEVGDDATIAPLAENVRQISLSGFGGMKMVNVVSEQHTWPAEDEAIVRVKACGLNFSDLMARQGTIDEPPKIQSTLGFECAGVIEAVGSKVTKFKVGDRVIGVSDYGAWAELTNINQKYMYAMPEQMNYHDGAAIFMNYVTAYVLLFDLSNLRAGQSLLVHSAGGGVGSAVCQLSKTVDSITVFGTASQSKHEAMKPTLDYVFNHEADYVQEIKKIQPGGVDIVLDSLCGEDSNRGISLLKPLGRYILFGSSSVVTGETKSFFSFAKSWWQVDKVSPLKLYYENKTIAGFNLRQLLFRQGGDEHVRNIMGNLLGLYTAGKIRPTIDSVWSFDNVSMAMQRMHDRINVGKIILDPRMDIDEDKKNEGPVPSDSSEDEEEAKQTAGIDDSQKNTADNQTS